MGLVVPELSILDFVLQLHLSPSPAYHPQVVFLSFFFVLVWVCIQGQVAVRALEAVVKPLLAAAQVEQVVAVRHDLNLLPILKRF